MIIRKKDLSVYQIPNEDLGDARPWFRVKLMLPQLSMETDNLPTGDYAYELIKMILNKDKNCPYCKKDLNV